MRKVLLFPLYYKRRMRSSVSLIIAQDHTASELQNGIQIPEVWDQSPGRTFNLLKTG